MKVYSMYYTAFKNNVKLYLGSSSDPCTYYGKTTVMTKNPTIQLRSDDSPAGLTVAFAKFSWVSRHILLGSGDNARIAEDKIVWEKMNREKNKLRRSHYVFSTSVGSESGARREYRWRRDMDRLASTAYKCVDDQGDVVANMLSGGFFNWKKGGEIELADGVPKDLEELLIVGALAIWVAEACGSMFQAYADGKNGKIQ
ncbi:MAG: hypothetical protein M1820_000691 [Bogoriella megaspora]|nr:MAG: hypothetical protein M1820_000691 [Bogoriella megaspora]